MAEPTLFESVRPVNPYTVRYPNRCWRRTLYAAKYATGMSLQAIADECGVTTLAVRDGLRRAGVHHQQSRGLKVRLSLTQLAYIAGLVDGEGCIQINRRDNGKRFGLYVSIDNTDRRMIEWLERTIQYGFCTVQKKRAKANWNAGYRFVVQERYAADLLQRVKPYLVIKREQAEVALEFQARKITQRGHHLTADVVALYGSYQQRLKLLKPRNQLAAALSLIESNCSTATAVSATP
jgi:hypothetical protein